MGVWFARNALDLREAEGFNLEDCTLCVSAATRWYSSLLSEDHRNERLFHPRASSISSRDKTMIAARGSGRLHRRAVQHLDRSIDELLVICWSSFRWPRDWPARAIVRAQRRLAIGVMSEVEG